MKPKDLFKFKLYVAGDTPNSARALINLTALCRVRLPDRYKIEIIDVLKHPKRALADGILMTPTLVKLVPSPIRTIVGTLNNTSIVLQTLGLEKVAV